MRLNWTLFLGGLVLLLLAGSGGCSAERRMPPKAGLRAAWVQSRSIKTPEAVDQVIARVEAGGFNAVFVEVFVYGRANYKSTLVEQALDLAPHHDPLGYLIKQAHRRGIQVHAWLIAGPVGGVDGPILSRRPDWAMVSLDGERANWLNYNRPEVRQFISDVALEIVKNYQVDGIHFDYTRYPHPGWKWGFDPYSTGVFAGETGLDPEILRYTDLPAYGAFDGNPLLGVTTAQVLAEFNDGQPAVLLNQSGKGEVVLFNWEADERHTAAGSEILRRSINYLKGKGGQLYLFRSETNAQKYGFDDFKRTLTWLTDLNQPAVELAEDDLDLLTPEDVLVMPSVYLIKAKTAGQLADLVHNGLGMIFIDGPTPSIGDPNLQDITGMAGRGRSFQKTGLLLAAQPHELIPVSSRSSDLAEYETLNEKWTDFRKRGINELLAKVYPLLKQERPDVLVSITVTTNHDTLAQKHFLDWATWLAEPDIDLLIPRAFMDEDEALESGIAAWQPTINKSNRVMLGLSVYAQRGSREKKRVDRLLSEIEEVYASGSNGIILFDLEGLSDEGLAALSSGPFSSPVANPNP